MVHFVLCAIVSALARNEEINLEFVQEKSSTRCFDLWHELTNGLPCWHACPTGLCLPESVRSAEPARDHRYASTGAYLDFVPGGSSFQVHLCIIMSRHVILLGGLLVGYVTWCGLRIDTVEKM